MRDLIGELTTDTVAFDEQKAEINKKENDFSSVETNGRGEDE